jgi:endonuclease I
MRLAPTPPIAATATTPPLDVGVGRVESPVLVDPTANELASTYANAQALEGAALLRELHELTSATHEPRSYRSARREMFRTVEDLDGRDEVVDLYSGRRIRAVDGLRAASKRGLTTEHVWPQSEGATDAARSDLHHLRPALKALNTFRSNLPFGEVVETEWRSPAVPGVAERSSIGTDSSGTKVFQPRASIRGDLARDQLYFFTRYHAGDRPDGYSTGNFRHSLPTLLDWHAADPVDASERRRNEAIAHLQGNRNPYVDHPEYVDRIDFPARLSASPRR